MKKILSIKTIGTISMWGIFAFCIFNAIYSFWAAILLYLIIGVLTEIVMYPINYATFIKALKSHESAEDLTSNKTAINIGFTVGFLFGIPLWPLHISSIVNSEETE